jgi:hypothetical protein
MKKGDKVYYLLPGTGFHLLKLIGDPYTERISGEVVRGKVLEIYYDKKAFIPVGKTATYSTSNLFDKERLNKSSSEKRLLLKSIFA